MLPAVHTLPKVALGLATYYNLLRREHGITYHKVNFFMLGLGSNFTIGLPVG